MMKRGCLILLFVLLCITYVSSVDVSECSLINESGTYVLTQDISGSRQFGDDCIFIDLETEDVIFDCQGYAINLETDYTNFIHADGDGNVTIQNCNLSSTDSYDDVGIFVWGTSGVLNATITNCTIGNIEMGIWASTNAYTNISNNIFFNATLSAIDITTNGSIIAHNNITDSPIGLRLRVNSYNHRVYDNFFNNTINVNISGINGYSYFNVTQTPGTNIVGGSNIGGNFWANSTGGFSETCEDANSDGICDGAYQLDAFNFDYLPLVFGAGVGGDSVGPNVTDYVPALDSRYNVSDVIQIGANVSDNTLVDYVYVNLTYPNASVSQLVLSNTSSWYNTSFTVSVLGIYNVTFVANDSSGNNNVSVTTNFTVEDNSNPNVTNVLPSVDTEFTQDDVVRFGVNVTDNYLLDRVSANLTYPNNSVQNFVLSNTSNWYNWSVIASVVGLHNITFFANDSSGNLNASESTNFTVVAATTSTSSGSSGGSGGGSSGGVTSDDEEEVVEDDVEDEVEELVEEEVVEDEVEEGVNYIQRAAGEDDDSLLVYSFVFGGVGLALSLLGGIMLVLTRLNLFQ